MLTEKAIREALNTFIERMQENVEQSEILIAAHQKDLEIYKALQVAARALQETLKGE